MGAMAQEAYETYTPAKAEEKIKECANQMSFATRDFANAGDRLVAATIAHRRAVTRAEFSASCPRVVRGEATVGDREAWINRETEDTRNALLAAETERDNAIEMLRSTRALLQAAMAINASVREAYRANMAP